MAPHRIAEHFLASFPLVMHVCIWVACGYFKPCVKLSPMCLALSVGLAFSFSPYIRETWCSGLATDFYFMSFFALLCSTLWPRAEAHCPPPSDWDFTLFLLVYWLVIKVLLSGNPQQRWRSSNTRPIKSESTPASDKILTSENNLNKNPALWNIITKVIVILFDH